MPIHSRAELTADGWSRRELDAALHSGALRRIARDRYTTAPQATLADEHLLLVRAIADSIGPRAAFSHATAALLHELTVPPLLFERVHLTHPDRTHGRRDGNVHVHMAALADEHVTTIDGLPCTGLARTAADVALGVDRLWGVTIADQALNRGVDRAELLASVSPHRRGMTRLRSVAQLADGLAGSPLESRSRVLLAEAGVPRPELQFRIADASGWFALGDFAWPEFGLIGEADGKIKYGALLRDGESSADAVMAEKAREQRIHDLGWRVVRWSWLECHDGTMVRRVTSALRAAGWEPRRPVRLAS